MAAGGGECGVGQEPSFRTGSEEESDLATKIAKNPKINAAQPFL